MPLSPLLMPSYHSVIASNSWFSHTLYLCNAGHTELITMALGLASKGLTVQCVGWGADDVRPNPPDGSAETNQGWTWEAQAEGPGGGERSRACGTPGGWLTELREGCQEGLS